MSSSNLLEAMQAPTVDQSLMSHEKLDLNKTLRIFVRNLQMSIAGLPKGVKYEVGPKLMNAIETLQDTCIDAYTADSQQERLQYILEAIRKTRYLANRLRGAYDGHFFPEAFFIFHFSLCESILSQLKNWRNTIMSSSKQVSPSSAAMSGTLFPPLPE